jgi:hypothetical protein
MSHQVFRCITKGYDQWALPVSERACSLKLRLGSDPFQAVASAYMLRRDSHDPSAMPRAFDA